MFIPFREARIFTRTFIIKFTRFYNYASQCCTVSTKIFSSRMNNNVSPMLQWTEQIWRCKCIVYNQDDIVFVCNISYCLYIDKINTRVTNRFDINSFSLFIDNCFKFFQMIGIYEFSLNPQSRQCSSKQIISTTVQCGCSNNIVTSICYI